MKLSQIVFSVLSLFLFAVVSQASPLEVANISGKVAGVITSYLPSVARSKQDTWVLIKIAPDQTSGFAAPGGATISGSYSIVKAIAGTVAKSDGTYTWSEPNSFPISASIAGRPNYGYSRWLESSTFSYPSISTVAQGVSRTLICILHEKTPGQDKFTNVHLVPDDWQENVLPAVLYLRNHPQLSALKMPNTSLIQARALLHNPNPYLVVTALQLLASSKNLTRADMTTVFASPDAKLIACSLVIAHLYSWSDLPENARWLRTKVAAIKSLNQLEGVAFGMFTLAPYSMAMESSPISDLPNIPQPQAGSTKQSPDDADLLLLIRKKLVEIDPNGGPADDRWRNIDQICRQDEMMQKYLPKIQAAPGSSQKP